MHSEEEGGVASTSQGFQGLFQGWREMAQGLLVGGYLAGPAPWYPGRWLLHS